MLKNLWEDENCTLKLAQEELAKAKDYQRSTYDKKTSERKLIVGDKVLLLLPTISNKLLLQWNGSFTIAECVHSLTYVLWVNRVKKRYHINMLKRYEELSALPK